MKGGEETFKNKEEIKNFSDKQKLRKFITSIYTLREILKVLWAEVT